MAELMLRKKEFLELLERGMSDFKDDPARISDLRGEYNWASGLRDGTVLVVQTDEAIRGLIGGSIEVCRPGIPGTEKLAEAIAPKAIAPKAIAPKAIAPKVDPYAPPPAQPKTWAPSPTTALAEAAAIVDGPRRAAYGHPLDNHSRTAAMWSAFLGVPVTAEQVCWMNILQKASRNVCSETRDNVVDTIGYAANIDIIKLEREARKVSEQ